MKGKILITALLLACCAAASKAAPAMIVLSSATYNSAGLKDDSAYAVTTNPGGDIFVAGTSGDDLLSQKYSKTLVLSPTAQKVFTNGRPSNNAKGITLDGLGNIIVAGEEMNASGNLDYLTLKYSQDFGALLSSAVYDGASYDSARAVKTDTQNNIFVAGYTNASGNKNILAIKYSPELNKLSSTTYDGGDIDEATAIAVDGSNNAIVAGFTKRTTNDFIILKYDNNLHDLYTQYFDGGGDDTATGVVVDYSNNIIVTGRQNGATPNYCTLKYDSFLNLLSSAVYDSGGTDIPSGVAVDRHNNIIVTGNVGASYFTIKYDQNFNVLSSASYTGGTADFSNAVAVDADDNALVTGQSWTDDFNYFTIKYNASPSISAVSELYIGKTANVTLTGKGFLADTAVSFQDAEISSGAFALGLNQITLSVSPSTSVILGVTTVTVTNSNGEAASYYEANTWLSTTVATNQPAIIYAMTKAGQITIDVPSNAFPYQETIVSSMVALAPGDLRQVGEAMQFTLANSSAPVFNVSIKLRYKVADLGGYPEGSLSLAYYSTSSWITVPSTVNTSEKSVTGVTKAFNTKFAVVKEAQGTGGGGGGGGGGGAGGSGIPAKVYPNPYRPGSGGNFDQSTLGDGIVFAGLGANQTVKVIIVDLAGQLVYQNSGVADSAGRYFWDTKTVAGGKAATGVYIYLITAGGELKKGKFSIIR